MEYLCKYKVYRVEILQGWCAARTTDCDTSYDVTIATYSLPDLYLSQMKNDLFVPPAFLVLVQCNFYIHSHPLHEQQEQTLLEGEKLWFYLLNGEDLDPFVLPWKRHCGHNLSWNFGIWVLQLYKVSVQYRKKSSEIFLFLWLYIIFCVHIVRDVKSHLICINQSFA